MFSNSSHTCPLSLSTLDADNVDQVIFVVVDAYAYPLIGEEAAFDFFTKILRCPLSRSTKEHQLLKFANLPAELRVKLQGAVLGVSNSAEGLTQQPTTPVSLRGLILSEEEGFSDFCFSREFPEKVPVEEVEQLPILQRLSGGFADQQYHALPLHVREAIAQHPIGCVKLINTIQLSTQDMASLDVGVFKLILAAPDAVPLLCQYTAKPVLQLHELGLDHLRTSLYYLDVIVRLPSARKELLEGRFSLVDLCAVEVDRLACCLQYPENFEVVKEWAGSVVELCKLGLEKLKYILTSFEGMKALKACGVLFSELLEIERTVLMVLLYYAASIPVLKALNVSFSQCDCSTTAFLMKNIDSLDLMITFGIISGSDSVMGTRNKPLSIHDIATLIHLSSGVPCSLYYDEYVIAALESVENNWNELVTHPEKIVVLLRTFNDLTRKMSNSIFNPLSRKVEDLVVRLRKKCMAAFEEKHLVSMLFLFDYVSSLSESVYGHSIAPFLKIDNGVCDMQFGVFQSSDELITAIRTDPILSAFLVEESPGVFSVASIKKFGEAKEEIREKVLAGKNYTRSKFQLITYITGLCQSTQSQDATFFTRNKISYSKEDKLKSAVQLYHALSGRGDNGTAEALINRGYFRSPLREGRLGEISRALTA
jgi:hypothetical protein